MARLQQLAFGVAGVVGGGAVSMTLMACYGPACVDDQCTDAQPRPITSAEIEQIQETLGAGTYEGVSRGASDRVCTMTVTGSVGTPRSVRVALSTFGGADANSIELVADRTEVYSVSVSSGSVSVQTATGGSDLRVEKSGEFVRSADVAGTGCVDLSRL